jgi:coenzyme F420-0:L-glutamate ligase/coenzyme F420-1:gamma-L-glutamate ligase
VTGLAHFRLADGEARFLEEHRVARLATVDRRGRPHVIPVCFVRESDHIYVPLDEKPKHVPPLELARVRNLLANPAVTLLVDDYAEDWEQLAYLMIRGIADIVLPGSPEHASVVALLRQKYSQYGAMRLEERPLIRITPGSATSWSWTGQAFGLR